MALTCEDRSRGKKGQYYRIVQLRWTPKGTYAKAVIGRCLTVK